MGKLFGTDGIRGVANKTLDCELAYRVGQAAAICLSKGKAEKPVAYAYRRNGHKQICKLRDEVSIGIFRRRKDGGVKRQQQINQHL